MESEWALNCVALGWGQHAGIWRIKPYRPLLCGKVDWDRMICNDYRWTAGQTIYNEWYLPSIASPSFSVGLTRFASGYVRFPFGRTLLPSPLP